MKISLSNEKERGMTLVIALVILGLLGLTLIATLDMVSSQRQIIASNQGWNSVIPISEAGVEDAMAHINYSGTTNLASDGWAYSGTNYSRTYTVSNGYYSVTISTSVPPVIVSQGFVLAPVQTNYITRTVQVNTRLNGLFPNAILMKNAINMSGGCYIDSFNSSNTAYSTGGQYDPSKAQASAQVNTLTGVAGAIAVGTGKIYGSVDTGPGGTVTVGSSGAVGTNAAFVNNGANGGSIEAGCSAANVNTIIPDVVLPNMTGALTPLPAVVGGTNYTYYLQAGEYTLPTVNLGGGQQILVSGNCTLYVSGDFQLSGSSYIYVASGGNLQLYVGGPQMQISGSGIVNGAQNASCVSIWGLPTMNALQFSGGAAFVGTIYAPEADIQFSGSATTVGAIVGSSMECSGAMTVHYDASLGGPVGYKYLVASWQEL